MSDSSRDQLDWLAAQYLLDALPPEQRARFERQLAEDQSARDALADAVELTAAIVAAEADGSVRPAEDRPVVELRGKQAKRGLWGRRHWPARPTVVASTAVALGLVALFTWAWMRIDGHGRGEDPQGVAEATATTTGDADLAAAWLQVRAELAVEHDLASPDSAFDTPPLAGEIDALATGDLPDSDDAAAPLEPPSWMLAAVVEIQQADALEITEGP